MIRDICFANIWGGEGRVEAEESGPSRETSDGGGGVLLSTLIYFSRPTRPAPSGRHRLIFSICPSRGHRSHPSLKESERSWWENEAENDVCAEVEQVPGGSLKLLDRRQTRGQRHARTDLRRSRVCSEKLPQTSDFRRYEDRQALSL